MTSFFQTCNFTLFERRIFQHNSSEPLNNNIIYVYDFLDWKLSNKNKSPLFNEIKSLENEIQNLKEKHNFSFGICVTTTEDINIAKKYASFLYVPAEFCRQGEILEAAKNSKVPIIVEKGNFLSPNDIKRLCEKINGCDFALVECGSSNGYSDNNLDPRSLHIMKKYSNFFGISLSDLFCPEGVSYSYRPNWLNNKEFLEAFIKTGKVFQASFFVYKNYGHCKLTSDDINKLIGLINAK
jgi:2-dehydro-3-deoxyphosphooctonate aldolase (KDO 8-P synthase)